jgi:hypothetical protein
VSVQFVFSRKSLPARHIGLSGPFLLGDKYRRCYNGTVRQSISFHYNTLSVRTRDMSKKQRKTTTTKQRARFAKPLVGKGLRVHFEDRLRSRKWFEAPLYTLSPPVVGTGKAVTACKLSTSLLYAVGNHWKTRVRYLRPM